MASIQAFLSVLEEFIGELKETFPELKKIQVYENTFQTMKKANPRKILVVFMEQVQPLSTIITQRDEQSLLEVDNDFLKEIGIKTIWTPELSQDTKNAIWQYMNTLFVLGTTINSIPTELLASIEGMAEQCASQMANNGEQSGTMPDMASLMAGMQNMIGSQMNKGP